MASFIHRDLIAEKLEMARTMGLVTHYLVSPVGSARRPDVSVRVWRSGGATELAVRLHLARLLDGLVSDHLITVTSPYAAGATIAHAPVQTEPSVEAGGPVPVAA